MRVKLQSHKIIRIIYIYGKNSHTPHGYAATKIEPIASLPRPSETKIGERATIEANIAVQNVLEKQQTEKRKRKIHRVHVATANLSYLLLSSLWTCSTCPTTGVQIALYTHDVLALCFLVYETLYSLRPYHTRQSQVAFNFTLKNEIRIY